MPLKTFIHRFSNGQVIRLSCDLSKPRPTCHSSLKVGGLPAGLLAEYLTWRNDVVLPELMDALTPAQIVNLALPSLK